MISVIIPTRNRGALLVDALYSLCRQSLPETEFEVLVIDNGSSDATPEVVYGFRRNLPNLSYLFEPKPGLHEGRHRGLREARGDLLVFADDDIEAAPTWLEAVAEGFRDPRVVMLGGNNLPRFTGEAPRWLLELWNRPRWGGVKALPYLSILRLPGGVREISPLWVWGCNFAIRRSALLNAGGFHPDGMPPELIRFRGDGETHVARYIERRGGKCLFHPKATVFHRVPSHRMTLRYCWHRGFQQGISDSFTWLRERHLASSPTASARSHIRDWVCRFAKRLTVLLAYRGDARRAMKYLCAGHAAGYAYHQEKFDKDNEVNAWVLKESYL